MIVEDERPQPRRMGLRRQRHRMDFQIAKRQQPRQAGRQRPILQRLPFVATHKPIGGCIQIAVENAGQAILLEIGLAGNLVHPHLVGFEERPETVEILLRDRVELVVVALGAVHRQAEERLGSVLDRFLQPAIAIENEVLPSQEAGRPQPIRVGGVQLVGGQHLADHLVVPLVSVEAFGDPVAPVPDMLLAVAHLGAQAPPVGIAPDIHPVPAPALAVLRRRQQPIHDLLVGIRRVVGDEGGLLVAGRRQPDQVQVDAPQQERLVGGRLLTEPALLAFGGQESVNRIADPRGLLHLRRLMADRARKAQ